MYLSSSHLCNVWEKRTNDRVTFKICVKETAGWKGTKHRETNMEQTTQQTHNNTSNAKAQVKKQCLSLFVFNTIIFVHKTNVSSSTGFIATMQSNLMKMHLVIFESLWTNLKNVSIQADFISLSPAE